MQGNIKTSKVYKPVVTKYFRIYCWNNSSVRTFKVWREENRVCVRIHLFGLAVHFGFGKFKWLNVNY